MIPKWIKDVYALYKEGKDMSDITVFDTGHDEDVYIIESSCAKALIPTLSLIGYKHMPLQTFIKKLTRK